MGTRFSKLKSHRGKFPKAHQATGEYYKMVDPCFEERMQELNRKLGNICLSPRPAVFNQTISECSSIMEILQTSDPKGSQP